MTRSLLLIVALLANGVTAVTAWAQGSSADADSEIWWPLPPINDDDGC